MGGVEQYSDEWYDECDRIRDAIQGAIRKHAHDMATALAHRCIDGKPSAEEWYEVVVLVPGLIPGKRSTVLSVSVRPFTGTTAPVSRVAADEPVGG